MDLFSYLLGAKNSGSGGSKIQYDVMPTPDETIVGKIIQYVGESNENYTSGYFYIGISDNEENPTYSWEQLDVQPSPDMSNYELLSNKINNITNESTNTQYPGAKAVWDLISNIKSALPIKTYKYASSGAEDIHGVFNFNTQDPGIYLCTDFRSGGNFNYTDTSNKSKDVSFCIIIIFKKYTDETLLTDERFAYAFGVGNMGDTFNYNSHSMSWFALSKNANNIIIFEKLCMSYGDAGFQIIKTSGTHRINEEMSFYTLPKYYTDTQNPTQPGHLTSKNYVDNKLLTYSGYDATKTQILKNINGTLTWVDE